ncbi:MAG: thioesterase [Crocinitomicaceae bacterium]|nr:thioesterase [Crocinitomicaceae bacterium]|tara:strand:- start:6349 stop:6762 length:414 start_codon:yes stop_codon:yes gene_type:complete
MALSVETKLKVRYAETDRMGYVYYGNYATYFEVGRVEAMKAIGMSYRELEDSGIMMPVLDYKIKYYKPAYYDDELTIITTIKERPKARITFYYETLNAEKVLINSGETTLVFVDVNSGRPIPAPREFLERLDQHLES